MTTIDAPGLPMEVEQEPSPTTDLDARAAAALESAIDALLSKQHDDGHWCAELEGDSILNSEYLLMKVILGQHEAPEASRRDLEVFDKALAYLRMLQRDDGSWGQFPGSPPDLAATVKSYFALKLFGEDPGSPHMVRARECVLAHGGAERINTFSMFYLACLGQVSWDACPTIPPEIVLLPRMSPFHLDKVAAWTRTMILPLALCTALRPVREVPDGLALDELFVDPSSRDRLTRDRDPHDPLGWTDVFLGIDRGLKVYERLPLPPLRRVAIRRAERWLLERLDGSTTDGLGAIFPPMVYIQIALQALGYERSHPIIQESERQLDRFLIEQPDHLRIQPCFSPVWDTGIALYALTEAGLTQDGESRIARTCEWLLEREVSHVGDWVRNLRPRDRSIRMGPLGGDDAGGAWAFEYRNDWYPDVDDTGMVAKALRRAAPNDPKVVAATERAVRWMVAMQNDDGGWAAFDRTTTRSWMEHVPFADHNAMQDPSCADIAGRTIEALVTCGLSRSDRTIRRAVAYLRREQRREGCWWGRWGVNFLYGTWQAVGGLISAGEDPTEPYLRRTEAWLRSVQNEDGGFGESANSYIDECPHRAGPSTASQTAWGLTTLMYLVGPDDPDVRRAVQWLTGSQLERAEAPRPPATLHEEPQGSWVEPWFTGTGFPRVFYLRYHLYRHYFPIMALARYCRLRAERRYTLPR